MGRVLTNNFSLAYAIESTLGVLPGSPLWVSLEPNSIGSFGSTIATVARNPISPLRQRRKGAVTDLDSKVDFEADFTVEHAEDFIEGFCFATKKGAAVFDGANRVTGVTATGYTVTSGGALAAGTLIYARGFTNSANNGLKVVGAASTATEIKTTGLVVEAAIPYAQGALLEVAGVQGAAGDITISAGQNIVTTVLDWTTQSLKVGQAIWIGGTDTANRFTAAADRGFARITAISATTLTLDKRGQVFSADAGAAKTIHIYFGRFIRNVATSHADYLERSFQFEGAYPNLDNPSGDEYEYALGNYCNEMTFDLPLTNKATSAFGFIGTDTNTPTATRATGASTPRTPVKTSPFNTTSDIARLRITQVDETGLTTDFKNLNLKMNNNVSPEKVLGILGARFMNTGDFEIDIDATVLFTDSAVLAAIRANTTVTMDWSVRNDDGAVLFDVPSMTLGDGSKDFPENETVLLKTKAMAFIDPVLGTSIGVSFFPFVPTS